MDVNCLCVCIWPSPQSTQLTEPLWTNPGLKSGISVHEQISTLKKKKKKAQARNELSNILPKSLHARKVTTTTYYLYQLNPKVD